MHLTIASHVVSLIWITSFEHCHIISLHHYLSVQAPNTLVSAFVLSQLDCCNSLLSGCPRYLLNRLRKVQNNTAHLILKTPRTDHITPHLHTLHWLPINVRIKYKHCSLCVGTITSTDPLYLFYLLKIYSSCRQLRSSANIRILCITLVNTKSYGVHCFFTTLQHSGTHFQKTQNFLSQLLPSDQQSRPTFFQHEVIVLIDWVVWECVCVCVCVYLVSRLCLLTWCDCSACALCMVHVVYCKALWTLEGKGAL